MKCTNWWWMKWVTDSCRDGWNVWNCSSIHIQVFRIDEMHKLVMHEMYEIGRIWSFWNCLKFEYEYSRIWVVSVVRAQILCQWWNPCWCRCFGCLGCACFVCMIYKIGLYTSSLWYKREYSYFRLSPLCLVYMTFLMAWVSELGCKDCIDWKQ